MGMSAKLINVLDMLDKLPLRDRESITELLKHDEWGVALEALCGALLEDEIIISATVYDAIRKAGEEMEMDSYTWESLLQLVRD